LAAQLSVDPRHAELLYRVSGAGQVV